jgi:hypothetical protein
MEQPRLDTYRFGIENKRNVKIRISKERDEENWNCVDDCCGAVRRSGAARIVVEQELIRDPHGW